MTGGRRLKPDRRMDRRARLRNAVCQPPPFLLPSCPRSREIGSLSTLRILCQNCAVCSCCNARQPLGVSRQASQLLPHTAPWLSSWWRSLCWCPGGKTLAECIATGSAYLRLSAHNFYASKPLHSNSPGFDFCARVFHLVDHDSNIDD